MTTATVLYALVVVLAALALVLLGCWLDAALERWADARAGRSDGLDSWEWGGER